MTAAQRAYVTLERETDHRNDLVVRELAQVYYIAARIRERLPRHVELEDLVSAGVLGLLDAAGKFDNARDVQFGTFAGHRIRGAILDGLRAMDAGSRSLRRRGREIDTAVSDLQKTLGREPEEAEIAQALDIGLSDLRDTLADLHALTIATVLPDDGGENVQDPLALAIAPEQDNPFHACAEAEQRERLTAAVERLSQREQRLLSLYYRDEMTMREIGLILGYATSRVSQIHAGAIKKLRYFLVEGARSSEMKPKNRRSR